MPSTPRLTPHLKMGACAVSFFGHLKNLDDLAIEFKLPNEIASVITEINNYLTPIRKSFASLHIIKKLKDKQLLEKAGIPGKNDPT